MADKQADTTSGTLMGPLEGRKVEGNLDLTAVRINGQQVTSIREVLAINRQEGITPNYLDDALAPELKGYHRRQITRNLPERVRDLIGKRRQSVAHPPLCIINDFVALLRDLNHPQR